MTQDYTEYLESSVPTVSLTPGGREYSRPLSTLHLVGFHLRIPMRPLLPGSFLLDNTAVRPVCEEVIEALHNPVRSAVDSQVALAVDMRLEGLS
jgi:hypothetical protein